MKRLFMLLLVGFLILSACSATTTETTQEPETPPETLETARTTEPLTSEPDAQSAEEGLDYDPIEMGFEIQVPEKKAENNRVSRMFGHISAIKDLGTPEDETFLQIDLIELGGENPRSTYRIERSYEPDLNFDYQDYSATHHIRNNTTTPMDDAEWLESITPTIQTVSSVFDLDVDQHLEYSKNARTTMQEMEGATRYASFSYIPEGMTSLDQMIPTYFMLDGAIGETHSDIFDPYTGDKATLHISMETPEMGIIDYDGYYNLADLTYDTTTQYHPFNFAIESKIEKQIRESIRAVGQTVQEKPGNGFFEVLLKLYYQGGEENISSDREEYKAQLTTLLGSLEQLNLTDEEITAINQGFEEASQDLSRSFQTIVLENERFIALVEHDAFMFGLVTTILYKVDEAGELIPYR